MAVMGNFVTCFYVCSETLPDKSASILLRNKQQVTCGLLSPASKHINDAL